MNVQIVCIHNKMCLHSSNKHQYAKKIWTNYEISLIRNADISNSPNGRTLIQENSAFQTVGKPEVGLSLFTSIWDLALKNVILLTHS